MTSSVYLALLFGSYITAVSIPMILNPKRLVSVMDDFIDNPSLLFLTGILALAGGVSVIAFHNIWPSDWRVLITLFGWVAAIEGALLLIAPGPLVAFAKAILAKFTWIRGLGVVYLALGLFFLSRVFI